MTVPFWLLNKKGHKRFDFIIIGGGVSGASTAYWLKKLLPDSSVAILEKHTLCCGASGRNAGFISMGSLALFEKKVEHYGLQKALEIRKFYQQNHALIKQEIIPTIQEQAKVDYRLNGSITLSSDQGFYASVLNQNGFDISLVSEKELKDQGINNFQAAFLDKGDASVHSFKLISEIFKKSKANIFENCEVYKVSGQTVLTNQGEFEGSKIIYAMNGYSNTLETPVKVDPIRAQIMVVKMDHKLVSNFYSPNHLCYFRPLDQNRILIGGFRKLEEKTEVGYSDHYVTKIIQDAFYEFLSKNLLTMSQIEIEHQWAGIMGYTSDDMPLVGQIGQNTYFIGGYNGHGMGQAFNCARVLVENVLNQAPVPNYLSLDRT